LTMGLRGTPSLCIFGRPYNLGDLEPDGRSCLHRSSLSEDFFSSCVVLRSYGVRGVLGQFLVSGVFQERRRGNTQKITHYVLNYFTNARHCTCSFRYEANKVFKIILRQIIWIKPSS